MTGNEELYSVQARRGLALPSRRSLGVRLRIGRGFSYRRV